MRSKPPMNVTTHRVAQPQTCRVLPCCSPVPAKPVLAPPTTRPCLSPTWPGRASYQIPSLPHSLVRTPGLRKLFPKRGREETFRVSRDLKRSVRATEPAAGPGRAVPIRLCPRRMEPRLRNFHCHETLSFFPYHFSAQDPFLLLAPKTGSSQIWLAGPSCQAPGLQRPNLSETQIRPDHSGWNPHGRGPY